MVLLVAVVVVVAPEMGAWTALDEVVVLWVDWCVLKALVRANDGA